MADGDAFALHVVAAHGGGVQQHVNQVVVEEVDLVDVQDAPVGRRNQPRLEVLFAGLDGLLNVQRPYQPVLSSSYRQVNDANLTRRRTAGISCLAAPLANLLGNAGLAAVGATGNHGNLWQQRRQRADGGALGRALLAPHQHAADAGVDGVKQQRALHRRLADDGGEWETRFASDGGLSHFCMDEQDGGDFGFA